MTITTQNGQYHIAWLTYQFTNMDGLFRPPSGGGCQSEGPGYETKVVDAGIYMYMYVEMLSTCIYMYIAYNYVNIIAHGKQSDCISLVHIPICQQGGLMHTCYILVGIIHTIFAQRNAEHCDEQKHDPVQWL